MKIYCVHTLHMQQKSLIQTKKTLKNDKVTNIGCSIVYVKTLTDLLLLLFLAELLNLARSPSPSEGTFRAVALLPLAVREFRLSTGSHCMGTKVILASKWLLVIIMVGILSRPGKGDLCISNNFLPSLNMW